MITFRPALSLVVLTLAVSGCIQGQNNVDSPALAPVDKDLVGAGTFTGRTPQITGTVEVRQSEDGLVLIADLEGLPPGAKGFHLHQTGLCDAPDFLSAGGHLNPLGKTHGVMSVGGAHLGDLPNLPVAQNGAVKIAAPIKANSAEAEAWLFDADGTAAIVHEKPDDYVSDPSGGAGPRIACAILKRP